jgi:kynurenine formamidase
VSSNGGTLVFDLEHPRTAGMPIHPAHKQAGYSYLLHRRHGDDYSPEEHGPRTGAAGILVCGEHTGTHIDALCHQADALTLCGGIPVSEVQTPRGFTEHGAEKVPAIVAPGVMLDVAALQGVEALEPGHVVKGADLAACCERQGVEVPSGGVALVRTGNGRFWEEEERYLAGPGMDAGAARWLADRGVVAVGADNMAWDVPGRWDPEAGCVMPGHLILLARRGVYIIENLTLESLAAAGHHEFEFFCLPLKLVGATGSPVRPVARVSDSG